MPRVVVVVPCYNEALRLPAAAFVAYARLSPDTRFLFVDDGSTDATASVLARLRDANPRQFGVHALPANGGKAEAVRAGCLLAFAGGADLVGYWDADLATPLDALPDFRRVLDGSPGVELVCGARVKLMGRAIDRKPARHYLGRVFASVASLSLGLHLYDTQCGAKLFRSTPRIRAAFARPFLTRWLFDIEVLGRLALADRHAGGRPLEATTYEWPLREWRDVDGSKVRPADFFKAFIELARVHRAYFRRSARPDPLAGTVLTVVPDGRRAA